jgi:purine-binding chemotaxis protein CheW
MDLAKIRQKARQEQENRDTGAAVPVVPESTESVDPREQAAACPVSGEQDFFQDPAVERVLHPVPECMPAFTPPQRILPRDPLEAILSGREAAGCGEDLPLASEHQALAESSDYLEYLCFKVSDEVYGVDIMDIKELIKPREVTEVPRAPSFVSGVISLRGVIIPIIDMLERLGLSRERVSGRERVVVVRQGESFCGLLVDEIIQVLRISKEHIEAAPTVLEGIDRDFVTGIGRAEGRMIILLNLANIIDIHLY